MGRLGDWDKVEKKPRPVKFTRGDEITFLEAGPDPGWWRGTLAGAVGYFPANYVAAISP